MRSELDQLEKFIQHCHKKQEGLSDTYIALIHSNMQELLLVQFLNEELQHRQTEVDELQKRVDKALQLLAENSIEFYEAFETGRNSRIVDADELEQALKGGLTPNLNTDENGECRHFSTTLFNDGEAECFHCDAVVNEKREVIGKQSKGLHPFFQKESK